MWQALKQMFSKEQRDAALQQRLEELRHKTPIPVFWLYGKTQSGKTSLIKFLTGADDAEIGQGFKPCTRFSRQYQFPTAEAPLVTFLDTRGMDEPGYDPAEDLARFDSLAHIVVITAKVMDHALEHVLEHFEPIRRASPSRPVVLALTCLHEAYPQQQHPQPYPFTGPDGEAPPEAIPEGLRASLDEQRRRFRGLYDFLVPIDLTRPEEGFEDPHYGGERLKSVLIDALPAAYRRTLITLDEATRELQDLFARHALPHIVGYSSLAASAGAIPIPWVDLLIIPGIQTRMVHHLAELYGQPLSAERFLEMASALGMGMVVRQTVRQVVKFIPVLGSVVGAALAGAATFALGKAFCYYYSAVHKGHVPQPEDLRRYYQDQLTRAEQLWRKGEAER
ncbi:MAG: GTP-binding DUF697 domain-containing protein [Gemmataceae bacterium]|nr:GTP-binding DUF697 domain-containing protein [Gemmataceae bacterium]